MSEENDYPKGEELGYEGDGPNLRYDDFVGRIVRDPKEPPSVTLLSGYLGSSSEEGHVRLYLDEELSRYVEIPEKAILHSQELSPEQSPLGGSLVWIDSGAEVVHGPAGSERRKATFLEGQIAQDYIGGAGGIGTGGGGDYDQGGGGETSTQTRECGGGGGLRPTEIGPACGRSQFGPCIPPTEQVYCRTLTGIFCTRFGPGCRRTLFEPACTLFGPNCRTAVFQQCHSVHYPCVTQNQTYCAESGFRGCAPIDLTVVEQFDPQVVARQRGGFGPGGGGPGTILQPSSLFGDCFSAAVWPCPSIHICVSRSGPCVSQLTPCFTLSQSDCPPIQETTFVHNCVYSVNVRCPPTEVNCPSRDIPCPTRFEPRCRASAVAFCPDTVAGCQVNTARCGEFDPGGGAQAAIRTQFGCSPSQFVRCPSAVDLCPTRINCPSRYTPCQSQLIRCPSALDACPTRFNCPSVTSPCVTQDFACETRGRCPSAVDACPTRFGCFETQICVSQVCQQSQACFPQGGGGGGFDPGGGGGGFGGGF